ncbi:response regulator transcription factor [Paraburkholderia strydomiana]|uniref:response regulator transcription factor n=1 Tax=Paraburkholderia strydomiana TaxID=1245417 RepID=UPI001BE986D0|nr:response regulator [Paraburkholderia strydomiana]MBT2792780.1 response regulator [Paraburkholderia strydomiana]
MINLTRIVAVVDDDESVRRALKSLLHSVGVEADIFLSGEAFLGSLSSAPAGRPACVIADFQMSGIDGLELQRRPAPTGMPIIFITGHDDPAVREKALATGAASYLKKASNDAELIRSVEKALELRKLP